MTWRGKCPHGHVMSSSHSGSITRSVYSWGSVQRRRKQKWTSWWDLSPIHCIVTYSKIRKNWLPHISSERLCLWPSCPAQQLTEISLLGSILEVGWGRKEQQQEERGGRSCPFHFSCDGILLQSEAREELWVWPTSLGEGDQLGSMSRTLEAKSLGCLQDHPGSHLLEMLAWDLFYLHCILSERVGSEYFSQEKFRDSN